jgi:sodium/proline symporter
MGVAILIGVIGSAAVSNGAISLTAENSQRIIIEIAKKIGENGIFFALLTGVIISGILASTMSTADSQLLAASSSISKDLLSDVFGLKI